MSLSHFATFAAGLLTFASPCILPLVPVYLALLGGASADSDSKPRPARTFAAAVAFSLGLSLVFVGLGLAATAAGKALVAHRSLFLQLGGLAVFLFGLKLLGALHVPWLDREARGRLMPTGGGLFASFALGATFALGWTPCVGPVLGSVLTYAAAASTSPASGALYLATYAAGLTLPLLATAAAAPAALRLARRAHKLMRPLQLGTGAVLAAVGVLLITDQLGVLSPSSLASPPKDLVAAASPTRGDPTTLSLESPNQSCTSGETSACGLPPTLDPAAAPVAPPSDLPKGPALVEFVGRACPICLRMAPVVAAAERGCAGRHVSVQRIEVEAPGGTALARRWGILGVPTFLFIDAKGEEVARLVGEQTLAQLEQSLSVLTGEKCGGFRSLLPATPTPPTPSGAGAQSS
jgi:cytochrome c-type biogenesis protein